MDRQQALAELQELKKRADALEAIINAPEVPEVPEVFAGVRLVPFKSQGYFIGTNGEVIKSHSKIDTAAHVLSGQLYPTEEAAKKAAKLAELQVKLFRAMAASWGDSRVPWGTSGITKFVIKHRSSTYFKTEEFWENFHMIAFKTSKDREDFIKNVGTNAILFLLQGMQYEGPSLW